MINNIRVGGICVVKDKILLIHKRNLKNLEDEKEYYSIPGGRLEKGETVKDALKREIKEETSLDVKIGELFFEMEDISPKGENRKHYYYDCDNVSGVLELGENSPESKEDNGEYIPVWLDIALLKKVLLFPEQIKDKILKRFTKS